MELALAPGIGTEGFRIEDGAHGGVRVCGNDEAGLLFGVGKLLRTARYGEGSFPRASGAASRCRNVRSAPSILPPIFIILP